MKLLRRSHVRQPPTDFKLMKAIYARHRRDFTSYAGGGADARQSKVMVPIDIEGVARELGADADSVFGRLYYHLEPRYSEEPRKPGGARKSFFAPRLGTDPRDVNCVNFPLLEAVLAGHWQQRRRDLWAVATAVFSLAVAIASLIVSAFTA
jgi:hypothetical protein